MEGSLQSGGILADEMGLGKTVEVLACILNNPRDVQQLSSLSHSDSECIADEDQKDISLSESTTLNESDANNDVTMTISSETESNALDSANIVDKMIPQIETQMKFKKDKEKRKTKKIANMSSNRAAAYVWYENKLAEMDVQNRRTSRNMQKEVECICGDYSHRKIVRCCECDKMQHSDCMNYRGNQSSYCCSQCWMKRPLIKSKATLIVSPVSISRQWSLEVQNHVRKNGLRILEYKGIHQAGMIYPTDLADYDLIITTYNVLQSELRYTNEQGSPFSFRNAKRYNTPNTPLLCIEWWRLCLDEAQTVECTSTQVACMAHQLNAVHRWAVTGTPIQKNISDLFGLINYLKLSPYDDLTTWNCILFYPYTQGNKQPMIEFLSKIMWRSMKVDVVDQINIPPQTFSEHWMKFSAVEKYFYEREHELAANDFLDKLARFDSLDITLKSLDRHDLNIILTPLLALRQACTHPHAVRGRYLASKRQVYSMEELLDALIKKNVKECEESLRAVIAAFNGMAGILLLQERHIEAIQKYREALQYSANYDQDKFLKVDKLQQIHTLYNLAEVLEDPSAPKPPPTLRDETIRQDCEILQQKYMEKYINQTRTAYKEAATATKLVTDIENSLEMKEGVWFSEMLDWCIKNHLENELMRKVDSVLAESNCPKISKYSEIQSGRTLLYLIISWVDLIGKHLKKLRKQFEKFETEFCIDEDNFQASEVTVSHAMDCHLRPAKNVKVKPCPLCVMDDALKKYECILFRMNMKYKNENESAKGNWRPSIEETLLKSIHSFLKTKGADADIIKEGGRHLSLCEARRKEFKDIRKLYTFYDQQVSAQDELNICKIRFRVRNPNEPVKTIEKKKNDLKNLDYELENKFEFINVLNYFELDFNYQLLYEEKVANDEKLKKMIGTHSYLETLRKQQYAGEKPDPCPICGSNLVDSWSILLCGHCYCLECIHKLLEQYRTGTNVTCSVCRKKQPCDDISYIRTNNAEEEDGDDVKIKGSYSTKIQSIIKCLMRLCQKDENVKVLIFSTWQPVLKVLGNALMVNDINYEHITNSNMLQNSWQKFKDPNQHVTALLLPINLGAKGLNLIKATHVFLVEPLMNPGEELQAIGRVHRMNRSN